MRIEEVIISNLVYNEDYTRKVLPFIKKDYFKDRTESIIIEEISEYFNQFNKVITPQILTIEISNRKDINDKELAILTDSVNKIEQKDINSDWLVLETEKFCKDKAVLNAILHSIKIIEGKDKQFKDDAIPSILSDALAVSFDTNVGHDYILDYSERYDHYHNVETKIPFDLDLMNKITGGGLSLKTLNCFLAGCVHPDTPIDVRITNRKGWVANTTIKIGQVKDLLLEHKIEVTSPDGLVDVTRFVDKGFWEEYILTTESGDIIRCNEIHLFQTKAGWEYAKDLLDKPTEFLSKNGWVSGVVIKTDELIPIVDITVDHENHRYYTNGVSSHNTGVGKSLAMCHVAASTMSQGKNVLYITMEMSEEKIAERIDSNLLNISITDLKTVERPVFETRMKRLMDKTTGKLIIKEYPTSSAHAGHFRMLLEELKSKKAFKPDLICIDYLNICASQRMKYGNGVNSYNLIKSIAEELRGLAVEYNVPIITATQSVRSAQGSSDMDLTDVSESIGIAHTLDLFIGLISTEELEEMGQIMVKQLKNRYNDISYYKRFTIGIDRSKMRLFDVESSAQNNISGAGKTDNSNSFDSGFKTKSKTIEVGGFKF
jgi:hypothetical protein